MRRIAVTIALLAGLAGTIVTVAGADSGRTYQVELFNAFGLVKGSELRVAGAKAGAVTNLDITPQKTAMVTVEEDSNFPEFKADASCSSEPQSLIAEYFLNCQPGSAPQPLNAPIPAARNKTTVQPDLAQNTLREPFRDRLTLLINEFGTALDGNSENLNAAIRAGAPALQQLKQVLNILGRQNTTIAELNTNADTIFAQLANRREDVVHFIDNAGRTAAISAERSNDLAQNFHLLDDFLFQLKPTMFQLGKLATNSTPLLTDLHAAAPGLNKLAKNLPSFNNGAQQSLTSLGGAAHVGKFALANSNDEIAALNQASTKAFPAADQIASFLQSIDDPKQAVEEDACARWDLREQPGEADRRVQALDQKLGTTLHGDQTVTCKWGNAPAGTNPSGGNPGFTGMEGLLNYAYVQTNSLNLFDKLGHALGITLVAAPGAPSSCGYQTGPEVPAKGGGSTTNPKDFAECAALLGDRQPGINYGRQPSGLFGNLPRYDASVCPDGSTVPAICDPTVSTHAAAALSAPRAAAPTAPNAQQQPAQPQTPEQQKQQKKLDKLLDQVKKPGGATDETNKKLQDLLNQLPQLPQLPPLPQALNPNATAPSGSPTDNLLNFLLGQ
jgi:phospholipid/cholesterol/gamma-HCH transport system substrate-binding protein